MKNIKLKYWIMLIIINIILMITSKELDYPVMVLIFTLTMCLSFIGLLRSIYLKKY